MKQLILLALVIISANTVSYSQSFSGYVRDASNNEALPSALIYAQRSQRSAVSNGYGYFAIDKLSLPDTITVSFLGYRRKQILCTNSNNQSVTILLEPNKTNLSEIEVVAQSSYRQNIEHTQMSYHHLQSQDIGRIATIFGEADALKTIQKLPGVNCAADGSTNISVRGGSYDQNLIMLDEATVYNPSHALGIFSAFNPDMIKGIDFYKSCFPAKYGGRLSSVVDMQMREGSSKGYHVQGALGIFTGRLTVEGPIKRDTTSFILSGRYGNGALINTVADFLDNKEYHDDKVTFFDISAKLNHTIDNKNRLYASFYASGDNFQYRQVAEGKQIKWNNTTGTLRWNHILRDNVFQNTSLVFSNYNYNQGSASHTQMYDWKAGMSELVAKSDIDHTIGNMRLQYGASVEVHHYNPGEIDPAKGSTGIKHMALPKKNSVIAAIYAGNEHRFGSHLSVNYGLRLSTSLLIGKETVYKYNADRTARLDTVYYHSGSIVKAYGGIEPRLAVNYQLADNCALKISYMRTRQYMHLLSNSALGMPTDIWTPADSYIKPQTSDQVAIGYHTYFAKAKLDFSVESYYKKTHDIIDFKNNATFELNPTIETEVLSGSGRGYGLEAYLSHNSRFVTASIAYTLSKATRQIDGINNGNSYFALYDQRHNLSADVEWRATHHWTLAATFKYHTGGRATLPAGSYYYHGVAVTYFMERNGYRMPDYHRLDLAFTYDFKTKPNSRFKSSLTFGVYNVYNRLNTYNVFAQPDETELGKYHTYRMFLFYTMPSLTYTFRF